MLKIKKNKIVVPLFILAAFCLLTVVLFICRNSGLEEGTVRLSSFAKPDTLLPPMRPGIQGIVISGPVLRDLIFDIDRNTGIPQPIIWAELVGIDQIADVKVRAEISASGRLVIRDPQRDIQAFGFPQAGNYIERILNTWTYFPHKRGTIKFHFNVGSRAYKLIIDDTGLQRNPDIPEKIRVRNGLMYYIKGLNSSQVRYEKLSF
jgi:hypothetical protein